MDWKAPYPSKIVTKPYSSDYKVTKFQKYEDWSDNSKEHFMHFLESVGRHSDNTEIYLEEFSKSLSARIYTWYFGLKLCDWMHILCLFNAKVFYTEVRFTLARLDHTRHHSNGDLEVYARRFCENTLEFCVSVSNEMLVSVCLHEE